MKDEFRRAFTIILAHLRLIRKEFRHTPLVYPAEEFSMIITDKQIRDSILEYVSQYKTFTGGDILKHLYDEPSPSKLFIDQTVRRIHTAIRSIVKWSPLGSQYKYISAFSNSEVTMKPEFKPHLLIEAMGEHGEHINYEYTDMTHAQAAFDQLRESCEIHTASLFNIAGSERTAISEFKRTFDEHH